MNPTDVHNMGGWEGHCCPQLLFRTEKKSCFMNFLKPFECQAFHNHSTHYTGHVHWQTSGKYMELKTEPGVRQYACVVWRHLYVEPPIHPQLHDLWLVRSRSVPVLHDLWLVRSRSVPVLRDLWLVRARSVPVPHDLWLVRSRSVPEVHDLWLVRGRSVPEVHDLWLVSTYIPPRCCRPMNVSVAITMVTVTWRGRGITWWTVGRIHGVENPSFTADTATSHSSCLLSWSTRLCAL